MIKESHKAVEIGGPGPLSGLLPPVRTLRHTLYVPERRSVEVSFYLNDEADPDRPGKTRIVRSNDLGFALDFPEPIKG